MNGRRFAVHTTGPSGDLGEFTLEELADAYPGSVWRLSADEGALVVSVVSVEGSALAWAVERDRSGQP